MSRSDLCSRIIRHAQSIDFFLFTKILRVGELLSLSEQNAVDNVILVLVQRPFPRWTELHTLSPASLYHLRLRAVNAIGESASTDPPAVVATREEVWLKTQGCVIDLAMSALLLQVPEGPPVDVAARANGSQAALVQWKVRRQKLEKKIIFLLSLTQIDLGPHFENFWCVT